MGDSERSTVTRGGRTSIEGAIRFNRKDKKAAPGRAILIQHCLRCYPCQAMTPTLTLTYENPNHQKEGKDLINPCPPLL